MTDSNKPSVPSRRWPDKIRLVLVALTWLALVVYFHNPVREVMNTGLDSSNYSSYAYFTAHGAQYGTEVVPMAGPYGFVMYGWVYSGELFWTRAFCELGLVGALATLTLWFFVRNRGSAWRWVWLAAHVAFTPFIEDLPIEWLLLLTGLFLLQSPRRPSASPWPLLAAALLAFLSLIKGTQLFLGLATLAVVLGGYAWQRRPRDLALTAGCYLGALLFFWVLAGQNPLHLPAYLRGVLELAHGYNDAMSLDEPTRVFIRGILVSAGLGAGLGWALWWHRRDSVTAAGLLLLAGHSFVQWKHGFVRGYDGHAYIYFHYALVAALALYLIAYRMPAIQPRRGAISLGLALLLATLGVGCYGTNEPMLPDLRSAPRRVWQRLAENQRHLRALPEEKAGFDQQLAVQRRVYPLPLTRRLVGQHSIDLFGFEHAWLRLNQLNYRPRPMGGGAFNVYTPVLMQLNRDFLRDPARRPDFYLLRIQTIDDRLPAQDDGLALLDLIQLYQPVLVEQDHLLLKAVPGAVPPVPRLVAQRSFQIGENVPVPVVGPDELLLARFDLRPSLLGRLRSALYKVPHIRIGLRGAGMPKPSIYRLVPAMAASPFLLSPMVENTGDLLELYSAHPGKLPGELRISTTDRTWFNRTVGVEFFAVPRPIAPAGIDVGELLRFTNTAVETVTTVAADSGTPLTVLGLLVHSPSRLSWALDGSEQSLGFGYGFVPAAYSKGGQTDGVEFIVTLLRPGQPALEIFRRLLTPLTRPEDRGHHTTEVRLPALPSGSRLELTTNAGPNNNENWDWAYVSDLRFLPDPASPGAPSK